MLGNKGLIHKIMGLFTGDILRSSETFELTDALLHNELSFTEVILMHMCKIE